MQLNSHPSLTEINHKRNIKLLKNSVRDCICLNFLVKEELNLHELLESKKQGWSNNEFKNNIWQNATLIMNALLN